MNLSEKISIIRRARRYSQEELGNLVLVSRQSVSDWEKGKFEPTLDSIRALADALNVSFDTLLNDKIDLNNKDVLNVALKNLDYETKSKINESFRYRIKGYTVRTNDYVKVILYFIFLSLFAIGSGVNAFFIKDFSFNYYLEFFFGSGFLTTLSCISLLISNIKKIKNGGNNNSFGTLSKTHFVIIGWSDSDQKFDRTIYVPVEEIESMKLGPDATKKHGSVIVNIKGRSKPIVTNDIVEPQKLIDIFNNKETFIDNYYGR